MQVLAFGREIPCETTATQEGDSQTIDTYWWVTVGTILIIVSLIDIFASDASENRTCVTEVSSQSELNTLPI